MNPLKELIDKKEQELTSELVKIYEDELAKCFKWFGEKFPHRKYDLRFIGGMGTAFWDLSNFNHVYTREISYWYCEFEKYSNQNDRLVVVLKPLYDFYNMVHEASDITGYGNGYPVEFGNRDYLWYENEYIKK